MTGVYVAATTADGTAVEEGAAVETAGRQRSLGVYGDGPTGMLRNDGAGSPGPRGDEDGDEVGRGRLTTDRDARRVVKPD